MVYDYDFSALVYPKWIKIKSKVKPLVATITTDGEVNEVVYQAKDIEITSNGTTKVTADTGYTALGSVNVKVNVPTEGGGSGSSGSKWTGHADAEGLRAIGWTDEDIAYYQTYGVNWNEEDDEYHKVSDYNKSLYGVLTAENVVDYGSGVVYLPKIDTSNVTDMFSFFYNYNDLIAIPMIDTSKNKSFTYMFEGCPITCIPPLSTNNVEHLSDMMANNHFLIRFPNMVIPSSSLSAYELFCECHSLEYIDIPYINLENGDYSGMFTNCACLKSVPILDALNSTDEKWNFSATYDGCISLVNVKVKNLKISLQLKDVRYLSKESLLYIINNEAATSPIVITLNSSYNGSYDRLATDADIVAALANHPNVTLAK